MTATPKTLLRTILLAATILTLLGAALPADEGSRTLKGEYKWNHQDSPGPLEAVFTPTGPGEWEVSFHFEFQGRERTYRGTAEGNMGETLHGDVLNENERRTFTFEGRFEEGVFHGTHRETTKGREGDTGTMTLQG